MRVLTHTACLLTLFGFGISGCESVSQHNDVNDVGVEDDAGGADGPACPEQGDKCPAACTWLADCAFESGLCSGYETGDGEARQAVYDRCVADCANLAALATSTCGHMACDETIPFITMENADFKATCEGDGGSEVAYNTNVNCPATVGAGSDPAATPDEEGVIYGTEDINRQYLNIYKAQGDGPKPVFLYSHQNGADACFVTEQQKAVVTGAGYTIVSWESHLTLSDQQTVEDAWADINLVVGYLRANAAAFNIDMNHIIVAGRSRGSAASWKFAHSLDPAIKGLYMTQALPDQVWADLTIWDPRDDVSVNSPPIHFAYNPSEVDIPDDEDAHDPQRGYDIIDVYVTLGIGDRTSIELGVPKIDLYNHFPTFSESLETSSP